jgi:hypothetical protein
MGPYVHAFEYADGEGRLSGELRLDPVVRLNTTATSDISAYRQGRVVLNTGPSIAVVMSHSSATASFVYVSKYPVDPPALNIMGLSAQDFAHAAEVVLPGQLIVGANRTRLVGLAVTEILHNPSVKALVARFGQSEVAVFPILREGAKYQIADSLFRVYGYYCDEVVIDVHHVFDQEVPIYQRRAHTSIFKDHDLTEEQRAAIRVAIIGDSVASGIVLQASVQSMLERFQNLQHIEVIAPFVTLRGLARMAGSFGERCTIRVQTFDTVLNALPADYYYSAQFPIAGLHIRPDLHEEYRTWWGQDRQGKYVADTACAGYGWSEAFFSPRKQIAMINQQLQERHNMSIDTILRRNLGL